MKNKNLQSVNHYLCTDTPGAQETESIVLYCTPEGLGAWWDSGSQETSGRVN